MKKSKLSKTQLKQVLGFQQNEINEFHLYRKLAGATKDKANAATLKKIADAELAHYNFFKRHTDTELKPKRGKIFFYYMIAKVLGLTFGIKLMERGESNAQDMYNAFAKAIPEAKRIAKEEEDHERKLIAMIREKRLDYVGSIVLGLNDALVELTGMLAGLSLAINKTIIVASIGLITGIVAALSMAAAEYLSSKAEGSTTKEAFTSSLYTGITYIFTVALLVLPFILIPYILGTTGIPTNLICIGVTLFVAVIVIFLFNFYISVAKDYHFRKRFLEMTAISIGVAAISFGIGYLVRNVFGIDA
jgi:VIT1/CCC1 family predicted Fe2+/Mn2+ transporter